jgi:tRNA(Ile)-lysidine synthase
MPAAIRNTGLIGPGDRVLVLLSGGADSVCLVHALRELLGSGRLRALHVNHRLRPAAGADERFCRELCERLGVPIDTEEVEIPERGNVEALARDARYRAAEAARKRHGLELIATGHTATDQAETVLYRLISSPGRRALLGMSPRNGRLVRPLLAVTADQTRAYCAEAGLDWREDETNRDRSLARNRLRLDVLPALREIHPAAERNVLATADELREEFELLERLVQQAAAALGAGGHPPTVDAARLVELPSPLRRLVLRTLAEQAAGAPISLRSEQVREIERLAARGGSGDVDLGGGLRAVCEYGMVRFRRAPEEQGHLPVSLTVPGRCRFGGWDVVCEVAPLDAQAPAGLGSLEEPVLDRAALAASLTVRCWSEGDRMRPLGLGGTKSLQDLFSDRKVPRSVRRTLPVVESDGEIAWVAGVAVSDRFKVTEATVEVVRLSARATLASGRVNSHE